MPYAQQTDAVADQLARLREALDVRLSALEAALADPSRSGSLAMLILDLARVATEEAQAAAASACLAIEREADRQVAHARDESAAALAAERAACARLEAAAAHAREGADTLERELREAQRLLEIERETGAAARRETRQAAEVLQTVARQTTELRSAHEELLAELSLERQRAAQATDLAAQAADLSATGLRDRTEMQAVHERLSADLARERETGADLQRALSALQAERDTLQRELESASARGEALRRETAAARADASTREAELEYTRARLQTLDSQAATNGEWRAAADRAEQRLKQLVDLQTDTVAKTAAARRDLAAAQADAVAANTALERMRAHVQQLEAQAASTVELRQAVEQAEQRLASAVSVQVQTLAHAEQLGLELTIARQDAAALRAELAALRKRPAAPGKKGAPPALASASEAEWASIRLAARCVLAEPLAIDVNGMPGRLVDLSVDGCQLLLPGQVKQNQSMTLLLPMPDAPIACTGKVAWTRPEPAQPGSPAGYRAGVAFSRPDVPAIEAFMARHT